MTAGRFRSPTRDLASPPTTASGCSKPFRAATRTASRASAWASRSRTRRRGCSAGAWHSKRNSAPAPRSASPFRPCASATAPATRAAPGPDRTAALAPPAAAGIIRRMPTLARAAVFATSFAALTACVLTMAAAGTTPVGLFTEQGEPTGWSVHAWDDVSKPGPEGAKWTVDENGVLNGSEPRGTWLVSDKEYGDFTIEFDWKLGERGNSGFGVRFPPK